MIEREKKKGIIHMKNLLKKIDSYLLILLLEIFLVVTIAVFIPNTEISILDFIMLCITFFTVMMTYIGGLVVGLILCSIIIFIYTSYIFYENLVKGVEIQYLSYLWIVFIPVLSFTMGKFARYITLLQKSNRKLIQSHQDLVTIDKDTGLGNIKLFYMNLDKEISKSKRHNAPCTLMLIKLLYYKEIKKIIGGNKTNKLIKDIINVILNSTRNEDDSYTLENDTLAIIMPHTDFEGASFVKDRIKNGITKLNLDLRSEKDYVNVDVKISVVEYNEEIKDSMEFKLLAEEELQYDV